MAEIPGTRVAAGQGFLNECVLHTHGVVLGVAAAWGHLLFFIEAAGKALIFYPICPGPMGWGKAIHGAPRLPWLWLPTSEATGLMKGGPGS